MENNKILIEDIETIVSDSSIPWENFRESSVLVTGATGSVGGVATRVLAKLNERLDYGINIIAIGRSKAKGAALSRLCGVTFLSHDITAPLSLDGNIDYIIHCAAVTKSAEMVANPSGVIDTEMFGTKNILELARIKNVRGMIYTSSMEVYGVTDKSELSEADLGYIDLSNTRSCYPQSKRLAETMCNSYIAQFGIPIRIVRLAMTFGAGVPLSDNRVYMQFINAGRTGNDIVLHTDGISVVSVTYLADAVRAIFNVLFSNTETVLNVSALSLSIWDMADTIASQYGVKVRIDLPDDATVKGYAPQSVLKLNADRLHSLGWQPHYNNIADICKRLADYVLVIPRKKQHINIVTKSSTAYLPYCQTMMVSCLENNKDFVLDFYIFTMDLSVDDKQSLNELVAKYDASVTVIEFDPEPVFIFEPLRRAKGKYGGQLTYSWLFSHSYLPESCNRALLLGSDTLCIGDLSEFYFTDFKDTYGVLCYGGIELIDRPEQIPPKLPASNKYTSADFYLLNLDKMRADNIVAQTYLDKYEQYCAENHVQRKMTFDETYLKVLLEQAVVLPAKKYCAQVLQFADTNDEFDENCAVIHYVHMQKPWTIDIGISLTAFDDYQKRLWSKGRIFYMLYRRLGVLSSGNDGKWRWIYGSIVDFAYKSATLWWKYAAMTSQYEKLCEDLTVANNQCEFALPSIVREIELVKERFYRNNLLSDKEILHFHDSNLIFRHDYNRIATLTRDGVVYFYPFVRCKQFCRVSLVSNLRNGVSYKLVVYMKIKSTNARVNVGVCRESQHSELQKLLTCSPLSYIENPTLTAFETTFTANSDNYDSLFFDPRNVFDTGSYIAISSILLTKLAN